MAKTDIEWATHTFNPWWGCQRVSPACENCYAEKLAPRFAGKLFGDVGPLWGPRSARPTTSDSVWAQPLAWERTAVRTRIRPRIFTLSMGDVFEDRRDLDAARERLWRLIRETPHCDWLLLTKRPQNVRRLIPSEWNNEGWPMNVWLGCTVENQRYADERIPHLISHPAAVRFLSVEPQLGPVDLSAYLSELDWVINGGESGGRARATPIEWIRGIRDQVNGAGLAYFFKQWGRHAQRDGQGDQLVTLKSKSFRIIDGRTWDTLPTPKVRTPRPLLDRFEREVLVADDHHEVENPVDDDAHVQAWLAHLDQASWLEFIDGAA